MCNQVSPFAVQAQIAAAARSAGRAALGAAAAARAVCVRVGRWSRWRRWPTAPWIYRRRRRRGKVKGACAATGSGRLRAALCCPLRPFAARRRPPPRAATSHATHTAPGVAWSSPCERRGRRRDFFFLRDARRVLPEGRRARRALRGDVRASALRAALLGSEGALGAGRKGGKLAALKYVVPGAFGAPASVSLPLPVTRLDAVTKPIAVV